MTVANHPNFELDIALGGDSIRRTSLSLEVEGRLRRSGYLALHDVSCDVRAGVARLQGRLPSFYLKQIAQELARNVAGVRVIINQIEVINVPGRPPVGHDRVSADANRSECAGR